VARYRNRISGPLLDRIDLHVPVPALKEEDLGAAQRGESSSLVRERVARAWARQLERQGMPNSKLAGFDAGERMQVSAAARALLRRGAARHALSARAHERVLKVSRTIADLEGAREVGEGHLLEALSYREPATAAPPVK
jgi:magnesium chelatase family protein